jgi:hypothetical protein
MFLLKRCSFVVLYLAQHVYCCYILRCLCLRQEQRTCNWPQRRCCWIVSGMWCTVVYLVEGCWISVDPTAFLRVDSSVLMMEAVVSSALVTEVAGSSESRCTSASLHGKTSQETAGYFSYYCPHLKSRWIIVIFKFEGQRWECCALSCLLV